MQHGNGGFRGVSHGHGWSTRQERDKERAKREIQLTSLRGASAMPEWISLSVVKDIVLAAVALYGAVLSTINWRYAARRDTRSVLVTASSAVPTYSDGTLGLSFARVEAINAGHRVVTITLLTFEIDSSARLYPTALSEFPEPDTRLPATLADGQSARMHISYQDIAAALIQSGRTQPTKLTPVCEDSVGNVYRGKPWDVDPQEFIRM